MTSVPFPDSLQFALATFSFASLSILFSGKDMIYQCKRMGAQGTKARIRFTGFLIQNSTFRYRTAIVTTCSLSGPPSTLAFSGLKG
jgi:hypothetical protein